MLIKYMSSEIIGNNVKRRPGRPRKSGNEKTKHEDNSDDVELEKYITHIVDKRLNNSKNNKHSVPTSLVSSAPAALKYAPILAPVLLPLATGIMNSLANYLNKKKEPLPEKSHGASLDGPSMSLSSYI